VKKSRRDAGVPGNNVVSSYHTRFFAQFRRIPGEFD
jgi:hypothetical protein